MAINLKDYRRTAAQRGWGAGWPSCGGAKAAGTAMVTADRSGTRFSVHKRIARLVDLISDDCERRGYLFKSGQTGGYNCRPIGGTSTASNHSWGIAFDVNWQSNPMRRPLTTDIPGWMVALFNRYGFAWGGHYSGTPDAMHFEFMGTPAQADEMTALALREIPGGVAPAPSTPGLLRRGSKGPAVADLQRRLGIAADGDYGPATEAAVRAFQRSRGLAVDGVAGPATMAALTRPATPAPARPAPEEDDMNDLERRQLATLLAQITGSTDPAQFPGWDTWGGGTGEKLTIVNMLRRANVEVRVLRTEHAAATAGLRAEVSALSKQLGELTAAVRDSGRPTDGSAPGAREFTGTFTAHPS